MIKLFTIKDTESNTTNHPFPMATKRDAVDALKQVVNDAKSTISNHPEDFQLYSLGEYDPRTMTILNWEPEYIISASELKQ